MGFKGLMPLKHMPETIEDLIYSFMEWGDREESLIIPQYLDEYGIGWSYLNKLLRLDMRAQNAFEALKAKLCARWLKNAMSNKEMPAQQLKILTRYITIYDEHALEIETLMKAKIAAVEKKVELQYVKDNYKDAPLEPNYKRAYDSNVNKRRSGETA